MPAVQHAEAAREANGSHASEDARRHPGLDERLGVVDDDAWQRAAVLAEPETRDYFAKFVAGDAEEHALIVQALQIYSMAQIQDIGACVKLL